MSAGLVDIAFARCIAKSLAEQIAHLPAGRQQVHVPRVTDVGDEAEEIIFVSPDIPFGPARPCFAVEAIGPQVAIFELALDQSRGDEIKLLPQCWIAGIIPRQRGGMQPFADMLAIVRLASRPIVITQEQAVRVNLHQPVRLADLHA